LRVTTSSALGRRAAVPLVEPVEEMPPRGIRESLEDAVIVVHTLEER
jgi:hypothetical protein